MKTTRKTNTSTDVSRSAIIPNIEASCLTIAYLNCHGQTKLTKVKQAQIEDFVKKQKVDILHCQEINIDQDSFNSCYFISSNFTIYSNNSLNGYGTSSLVHNDLNVENIKVDTEGRAIIFNIGNITFGNMYLKAGTDNDSRTSREQYCSEILPQLFLNVKESGTVGGDWNCCTERVDSTHNHESKHSPSLKRMINVFHLTDTYRSLHKGTKAFSRFYNRNRRGGGNQTEVGASRIDRSYFWGGVKVEEASYISVAFSDHLAYVTKLSVPENQQKMLSPKVRPCFKTSPDVVQDQMFKMWLLEAMEDWKEAKERIPILTWWEHIVKPGIRSLAMARGRMINQERRRELNSLMIQQSFLTKEIQAGDQELLGELWDLQGRIQDWYQRDSQKIIIQSRVQDVQSSEKVRIFHHDQHQKRIRRAAILKLDTEDQGVVEGHRACSEYLASQVASHLGNLPDLDPTAQETLLREVSKVFSEEDNKMLEKTPSKDEVLDILKVSNLKAAPGTDSITTLLYRDHWSVVGDAVTEVVAAVWEGAKPTTSMRTSLMVFGTKPKKAKCLKPSSKRRISLINTDMKLIGSILASRFKVTFTHTLSPVQTVAGDDRRIHHMINMARNAINSMVGKSKGAAICDLDLSLPSVTLSSSGFFQVLRAKSCSENTINRISNIYQESLVIAVINGVAGHSIQNIRGTLKQG